MPEPLPTVTLGDAIHYLRTRRGLSSRALSLAAGLSSSYISKLEAGEVEPSLRAFGRLALVLGMTQAEIFFCVVQEGLRQEGLVSQGREKILT